MNKPKYTQDQKRRAVQEIVRRLEAFDGAMKLIRQFDITEQDVMECLDPPTSLAYDPYTGQPISGWAMRGRPKSNTTFDQAVEEATELRTRAMEAAAIRFSQLQGLVPHPSLKSYTDWA